MWIRYDCVQDFSSCSSNLSNYAVRRWRLIYLKSRIPRKATTTNSSKRICLLKLSSCFSHLPFTSSWTRSPTAESYVASCFLFSYTHHEISYLRYLPTLLSYPISMAAPRNWDLSSVFPDSTYSSETISISRASYPDLLHPSALGDKSLFALDSPTSIVAYPLIDRMAVSEANNETQLLGFLWGTIHW